MPIIINNRNLLTWPKAMLGHIQLFTDVRVVLVDNASTYAPLIDWYATDPCEIIRLGENIGHHAPWISGIVDRVLEESGQLYYVVTDPDMDLSGVPADVLEKSLSVFDIYGDALHKVGLSLEIDDLPKNARSREICGWESQYWGKPCSMEWGGKKLPHQLFMAAIDTTWAMYRKGSAIPPCRTGQVRLDRPYTARHLPWYITEDAVDEEYGYYIKTAQPCSTWSEGLRAWVK